MGHVTGTGGQPDAYATAREMGLMLGYPPPPDARVTRANWFFAPYNRWALSHLPELIPGTVVSRGEGTVRDLPMALVPSAEVEELKVVDHAGTTRTLAEMLQRTYNDAIVVLHRGQVVYERYDNDLRTDQSHLLASVTKSFTGMLVLLAADDGLIDLDGATTDYIPELAASAFGDTTVRQVLDMVVAARWDELEWLDDDADASDEDALFIQFLRATGSWVDAKHDPAHGVWDFATTIEKEGRHGEAFMYLTPATDVLAWILSRVHDRPYAEVLSERIWSRIGAEHSAVMLLDPVGSPVGSGGLNATLRDLARFGLMVVNGGRVGEEQVVPPSVIDTLRSGGDQAAFARCPDVGHMGGWSYRAQWWVTPDGVPTAWGVCGQILWADHQRDIVIARVASAPDAVDAARDVDESAICEALLGYFGGA